MMMRMMLRIMLRYAHGAKKPGPFSAHSGRNTCPEMPQRTNLR